MSLGDKARSGPRISRRRWPAWSLILASAVAVLGSVGLLTSAFSPTATTLSPLRSVTGWEGYGGTNLPGAEWRPYKSSSPFNQSTKGDAVLPNSSAIVARILSWGQPANILEGGPPMEEWTHPAFFAQPSDPLYTIRLTEPWGSNPIAGDRIPIPAAATPANGSDGHMTIVTPEGWEYDFWRAQKPPSGGGVLTAAWGGRTRMNGKGLKSGGTASDFGNLAGLIREPELAAGHINHALFVVLRCAAPESGSGRGSVSSFVYPAFHGGANCPPSETNTPPLGARLTLAMSATQINALPVPGWKKAILTALAEYGGYFGDTGGPGFELMFESSLSYTALGLANPFVTFAASAGVPQSGGRYVFEIGSGVEWAKYLRVLEPPRK
jgi:hypothetical protein